MDEHYLRRALKAALRSPIADPNPRVGCVLVLPDGEVITGWHRGAGTPHAEADALAQAGDRAAGATAYVSLEPCAHHGRTPPCAQALTAAGVRRVVHAASDPHRVAAGGAAWLQTHGVDVAGGLLRAQAEEQNFTWRFAQREGRPWVTLKLASTIDGRVAAADGSSRWVTGPAARADAHAWRARCGAVIVGTGTVVVDDPRLTVRDVEPTPQAPGRHPIARPRQPLRVIVGQRQIASSARVFSDEAETIQVRSHNPDEVLDVLHERGIHHVLLEGGPTVSAAFLRAGLVDEVCAYIAPLLLGAGAPAVEAFGVEGIDAALRLTPQEVTVVGEDIRLLALNPHARGTRGTPDDNPPDPPPTRLPDQQS